LDAPQLEHLQLGYSRSSVALYQKLARNDRLPHLHTFHQTNLDEWIGKPSAGAITDAIVSLAGRGSLRRLSLWSHLRVGDAAVRPFFESAPATLHTLELDACPVTDSLARVIAASPKAR